MLHSVPQCLRLQKLGGIQRNVKGARVQIGLLEIIHDLAVCGAVALVLLHHIGEDVPVLRLREGFHRLHQRERLETKLRYIAEEEFPVLGKRLVPVPYIPVMRVTSVRIIRIVKASP